MAWVNNDECMSCDSHGKCTGPQYIKLPCGRKAKKEMDSYKIKGGFKVHDTNDNVNYEGGNDQVHGAYGPEVMFDCHECDITTMTEQSIRNYFKKIVEAIDMIAEHTFFQIIQDPLDAKFKRITAIQFILTSNITVHTVPLMERVYVNIFSCKEFSEGDALRVTQDHFKSGSVRRHRNLRN